MLFRCILIRNVWARSCCCCNDHTLDTSLRAGGRINSGGGLRWFANCIARIDLIQLNCSYPSGWWFWLVLHNFCNPEKDHNSLPNSVCNHRPPLKFAVHANFNYYFPPSTSWPGSQPVDHLIIVQWINAVALIFYTKKEMRANQILCTVH